MRARDCHKCGSISGVYYDLCDDCMTKLNVLEARVKELEEGRPTDLEEAYASIEKMYVRHRDDNEKLRAKVKELEGWNRTLGTAKAEADARCEKVTRLEQALQAYIDKFGNCGAVYVQALEAMQGREE